MAEINTRIVLRHDEQADWANAGDNATLKAGEAAIEIVDGKAKMKVGTTEGQKFADAPYIGGAEANVFQIELAADATDIEAAIAAGIPAGTELAIGDIAIVKAGIGESDKTSYTSYVYEEVSAGTFKWVAMDGNYSADNVYFGSDLVMTANIGVQSLGDASSKDLATTGKSLKQVLSMILAKEEKPSITANPAVTTKLANNTTPGTGNVTVEGGSTIVPKWSASLSAGSYNYGPATGITAKTWSVADNRNSINSSLTNETSTSSSGTFTSLVLPAGKSYKVSATATYDAAPLAYTNLGEEYKAGNALFDETEGATSVQIAAGSKSDDSPTITAWQQGYYIGSLESDVEITSDILRNQLKNVHKKGSNYAACTNTWDFSGKQAKFVVAYPATVADDKGLTGFFNGTSFEEYVGNFTKSTVKVAGADGDITSDHAINYTVCTWVPAAAFEGTFSFKITLS